MANDIYLQSDPLLMHKVMRQTPEPCFAFTILAERRIRDRGIEQTFRTRSEPSNRSAAFTWGVFPRVRDKVREDSGIVHRILTRASLSANP